MYLKLDIYLDTWNVYKSGGVDKWFQQQKRPREKGSRCLHVLAEIIAAFLPLQIAQLFLWFL